MSEPILRISDLSTRFFTKSGQVNAVESLSVSIDEGEIFGIVGESGSGKSVLARSIIGLIESPGQITGGKIEYRNAPLADEFRDAHPDAVNGDYVDLRSLPEEAVRSLRGPSFSMIFQDPESSFNPTLTVGEQIAEAVEVQRRASSNPRSTKARTSSSEYSLGSYAYGAVMPNRSFVSSKSKDRAIELLQQVGIPDPEERVDEYPHEYSGGMLQRAMIAQALAGEPDILIADEPTTALDVTIQAQVLNLLREIQDETGMTVLLITHNLGVIARMCDRVGVMYAGEVVERGTLSDIFDTPVHPYTKGLLGSIPDLDTTGGRLQPIDGNVPSLMDEEMGDRCYFADRCPKAMEQCLEEPDDASVDGGTDHEVKCVLAQTEYDESQALGDSHFGGGDT
ncbi:peptide/nickel transport system ATP-binding protein [Halovenus aranensis]|uniref:Nickel import system ATP-binding protein NikD n=1 Tax=Halovenus aranensis TaxID=890420 RepID=A0A1G8Z0Y5_9EURY|nr:ABC transporter ATP-binding protein [Halovenus aranensis]SDK08701.1 peptide/nickel transport system ATP-binding protein [Halovenus aranensis]